MPGTCCIYLNYLISQGFSGGTGCEEPTCQCRRPKNCGFDPWVGKISWRRKWQPIPVFLTGESHGQRSLAGHSPWGHTESDTTWHISSLTPMLCGRWQLSLTWMGRQPRHRDWDLNPTPLPLIYPESLFLQICGEDQLLLKCPRSFPICAFSPRNFV